MVQWGVAHMNAHNLKARELRFNPKSLTLTFHCFHVNIFLPNKFCQNMELKLEHWNEFGDCQSPRSNGQEGKFC